MGVPRERKQRRRGGCRGAGQKGEQQGIRRQNFHWTASVKSPGWTAHTWRGGTAAGTWAANGLDPPRLQGSHERPTSPHLGQEACAGARSLVRPQPCPWRGLRPFTPCFPDLTAGGSASPLLSSPCPISWRGLCTSVGGCRWVLAAGYPGACRGPAGQRGPGAPWWCPAGGSAGPRSSRPPPPGPPSPPWGPVRRGEPSEPPRELRGAGASLCKLPSAPSWTGDPRE